MWNNVPDDWNSYHRTCSFCSQSYHASEGSCDCEPDIECERSWLASSGYEVGEDKIWTKVLSKKNRLARKDHKDGKVLKGQRYLVTTLRCIADSSGQSWFHTEKVKTR